MRPCIDTTYVVLVAQEKMTLSPFTLPLSSTFSIPKNFCRALTMSRGGAAAASNEKAHRAPGTSTEEIRLQFMNGPPEWAAE